MAAKMRNGGIRIVAGVLLVLVMLTGCTSDPRHEIRVVSLAPNWTNTVASIGALDQIKGVTRYCIFPDTIPVMVEAGVLTSVGGFMDINMALVDSLQPGLVLTATDMQKRFHPYFEKNGIPYIHMSEESLAETYQKIIELGSALGREKEAGALVRSIQKELSEIEAEYADIEPVTVYYEINYYYTCVPGADSYITELMKMVGGDPIFSDRPGVAASCTWEEAVEANPEVILIPWWATAGDEGPHYKQPLAGNGTTTPYRIAHREGANKVIAVQTGRVRFIDSAKTKQAGPLIPEAARLFAEAIHAEGNMERLELNEVPRDINDQ